MGYIAVYLKVTSTWILQLPCDLLQNWLCPRGLGSITTLLIQETHPLTSYL